MLEEQLLDHLELQQMQEVIAELLQEDSFQIREVLERILSGDWKEIREQAVSMLRKTVLSSLIYDRQTYLCVFLLVLVAALLVNLSEIFGNGQTADASFYLVYMLLSVTLIHFLGNASHSVGEKLQDLILFMKALMPSYFTAVTASTGSATAMIFYEMVMLVIYLIQNILLKVMLPGIRIYVLLEIINNLHKEDFLSKLAEFLKTGLSWIFKTCTGAVIGMQMIQNMIGPAVDSLKRNMFRKTASAIPGAGHVINGLTEVALGTAVLIRNGLGVMGILVLLWLGLPQIVKLGTTTLLYQLLSALFQPISDKRMVGCLSAVGDGCRFLLKVLVMVELLFMITIAILTVSFVGV